MHAPSTVDAVAVVSGATDHHDTVQSALASGARRVHVHELTADQSWPVVLDRPAHLSAEHGVRVQGHDGAAFRLAVGNERPPGVLVEGFDVRGGTTAFHVAGTKFTTFRDCHVRDATTGWHFEDTDAHATNSNRLADCTVTNTRESALVTDAKTHSLVLDTVRVLDADGYGLLANGPANVAVRGGQFQDCSEAGVKLRRCDSPVVRDAYFEGNGADHTDAKTEVLLVDCEGALVTGTYFQGLGNGKHAVYSFGPDRPTVEANSFRGYTTSHTAVGEEP